jgi:hypothetical protein
MPQLIDGEDLLLRSCPEHFVDERSRSICSKLKYVAHSRAEEEASIVINTEIMELESR